MGRNPDFHYPTRSLCAEQRRCPPYAVRLRLHQAVESGSDDANDIARLLHISDEEKRYIENAEVGSGLLIADKVVVPFNNTFPQDTELFRLMDTNPNRKK